MASNESDWNSVVVDNEGHDFRFSLTIKNFLDYECKPGELLGTCQMECTQRCGVKWILLVHAHGKNEEEKDNVGVYLKLVTKPPKAEPITASYVIYSVGKGECKTKTTASFKQAEESLRRGFGCPSFLKRSEIASKKDLFLPNGHLVLRCEGKEFLGKPRQTLTIENFSQVVGSNPSLSVLKKMYEERICSDVILKTGSSEFKCHKTVLASTSAYFKAMFGHDMKENRDNVVDLSKDLNEEELRAVLDFIYLGKPKLAQLSLASVQNLFRVSDTYEIGGLQAVCETELIRQLKNDNFRELINFAFTYCAKRLEKAAAKAIAKKLVL